MINRCRSHICQPHRELADEFGNTFYAKSMSSPGTESWHFHQIPKKTRQIYGN